MFSNNSLASQSWSRPSSHVFPLFHSSLPYTSVRDFAYPVFHPLHYGPPPSRASELSSPASEHRRLSDPPRARDGLRASWSAAPRVADFGHGHQQLPAMSFGDGPPYSEDEDLHSPVVTASRHRKIKSTGIEQLGRRRKSPNSGIDYRNGRNEQDNRGMLVNLNVDGSKPYFVNGKDVMHDGPGDGYFAYSASEGRYSGDHYTTDDVQQTHDQDEYESEDDTRYSMDYQFAIGCPDEEMHGKAVALFNFEREHENELPLQEGQVIFVSYRHGDGWLVAEDPKTGESGLVPEQFVRLLRDIEGGLMSLHDDGLSPDGVDTNTYLSPDSTDSDQITTPTQNGRLPLDTQNGAIIPEPDFAHEEHHVMISTDEGGEDLAAIHYVDMAQERGPEPDSELRLEEKSMPTDDSGFLTKT